MQPSPNRSDFFSLNVLKSAALRGAALVLAAIAPCGLATAQTAGIYTVTNLISDGYVPATTMDPGFVDPWGVSGGNTLWINTNVTGFSYVTSVAGVLSTIKAVIPPAVPGSGPGEPTGTVQNTTTGFILSNGTKASFLFATSDGSISGWNSAQSAGGNNALIEVNNSASNAVYTGMALITNTSGTYALVSNFGQGADVEIYNTSFQRATLAGTFTDPNIPAGYAPYNVVSIGSQVFVTYMLRTVPPFKAGAGTYQEILGTNTGFVSVFDDNGNFVARAATGGNLNAPWGVAIAPTGFGIYGGDLLIGNFGDGLITAYNPTTYAYQGTVADGTGKPIVYPGLWALVVSTATAAIPNAVYFTAGLDGETHGLFGAISNGATTNGAQTFNLSSATKVASVVPGSTAGVSLSLAPTNGFSGVVTLSCSGLPVGATCNFSSSQIAVTPTAPALAAIYVQTTAGSSIGALKGFYRNGAVDIASALLLPFGSLLLLRRRRQLAGRSAGRSAGLFPGLGLLGVLAILFASTGLIAGCSSTSPMVVPATAAGTSNVTIAATSGSITQTTVVALTVQ